MKKLNLINISIRTSIILISLILAFSCKYSKITIWNKQETDKITFKYIDIYTTTPLRVSKENFDKYFNSSIIQKSFSNIDSIRNINNFFDNYIHRAQKFSTDPDIRVIVSISNKGKQYQIYIGSSIVSVNNENYIIDEQLIKDINSVLKTDW